MKVNIKQVMNLKKLIKILKMHYYYGNFIFVLHWSKMLNIRNYNDRIKIDAKVSAKQMQIILKGENQMKRNKNNSGITLIALVVTIIVLLILARC